ncbi:hypothetical protein LCGC14_1540800 [marine sediment metagenome]|uniref:Uncharacterized protein n=1 Tax=marine sediment metagenome TaxID=412755 RepID=A0A0F9L940_9ZZZZ
MYIKVTAGDGPNGMHGDFLCKVFPPIHFDYVAEEIGEDAVWDTDGSTLLNPGTIDFNKALNAHIEFMHLLELHPLQTTYEKNKNLFTFRYVWWIDPETGLTAVITTRNIFILGENGKTIDRVR